MVEIYRVQDIVRTSLEEVPATRNSDTLLYVDVCNRINPIAMHMSFSEVMLGRKELGLPKFESVERVRRKLQEQNEELRATDTVTDARYENWKVMRDYVLQ